MDVLQKYEIWCELITFDSAQTNIYNVSVRCHYRDTWYNGVRSIKLVADFPVLDKKYIEHFMKNDMVQTSIKIFATGANCRKELAEFTTTDMGKICKKYGAMGGNETYNCEQTVFMQDLYKYNDHTMRGYMRFKLAGKNVVLYRICVPLSVANITEWRSIHTRSECILI